MAIFKVRFNILGISVTTTGPAHSSPATDLVSANQIGDYQYLTEPLQLDEHGVILRCASGLGPPGMSDNTVLGGWEFGGVNISIGRSCEKSLFQIRSSIQRDYPGIINLYPCGPLSTDEEGVYSCRIMNSSMMLQTVRVGLYLNGRSKLFNVIHNNMFTAFFRFIQLLQ